MEHDKTDWGVRIRELLLEAHKGHDYRAPCYDGGPTIQAALQFGREMADARADEIADRIEGLERAVCVTNPIGGNWLARAKSEARSFISKPTTPDMPDAECTALATALVRWMKDHAGVECATVTVTRKPPKTREQVLEEALRKISDGGFLALSQAEDIARSAMEWKPT